MSEMRTIAMIRMIILATIGHQLKLLVNNLDFINMGRVEKTSVMWRNFRSKYMPDVEFVLPNLEEIQSLRMIDVKKSEINPVFCQICFVVIYFLQNLFCCYLRASVWRKIKPKILYGEKNDRYHHPSHLSSSKS